MKHPIVLALAAALALAASCHSTSNSTTKAAPIVRAICVVRPAADAKCTGVVRLRTLDTGAVEVVAEIQGLKAGQQHAIHIHEFGDTTDLSGMSAGGHYNPAGLDHGLPPSAVRHAGDLGNLTADASGKAQLTLQVDNFSISGANAVLGRAIVVHALPDDGGQPTGNAGGRIGFGVIGVAK